MRARLVSREELKSLCDKEWVDKSRRPYVCGDDAWVPVRAGYDADRDLPEKIPYSGRGYQMIGDIVLIHGSLPTDDEIRTIVEWKHPRGIVHIESFNGVKRIPETSILYGECGEVCHREHGYRFWLDPSKVMFAMGNREEKVRIAEMIKNSGREEIVADMFAGIGYFTIPAACSGAEVHAMEINPVSYSYLKKNAGENGVSQLVHAECGDCRALLKGEYDRVLMGHFDAVSMLPHLLKHIHPGSILHVHSIGGVTGEILRDLSEAGYGAEISTHRVKKYGPGKWHIVQDVIVHEKP